MVNSQIRAVHVWWHECIDYTAHECVARKHPVREELSKSSRFRSVSYALDTKLGGYFEEVRLP